MQIKKRNKIVLVIGLLLVALWFLLPVFGNWFLPKIIRSYGFSEAKLQIIKVNFNQIDIKNISMIYQDQGAQVLVSIPRLVIHYHLSDVFAGELESAVVDQPTIWIKSLKNEQKVSSPINLSILKAGLQSTLSLKIPIKNLEINQLVLHYLKQKDMFSGDMSLHHQETIEKIVIDGSILNKDHHVWVQLARKNEQLTGDIQYNQQSILEAQLDQHQLLLQSSLSMDHLNQLKKYFLPNGGKNFSANQIKATLDIDLDSSSQLIRIKKAEVNIDQLQSPYFSSHSLHILGHSKVFLTGQLFSDQSHIQFDVLDTLLSGKKIEQLMGHFDMSLLKMLKQNILEMNQGYFRLNHYTDNQYYVNNVAIQFDQLVSYKDTIKIQSKDLPLLSFSNLDFGFVKITEGNIELLTPTEVVINQDNFKISDSRFKISSLEVVSAKEKVVLTPVVIQSETVDNQLQFSISNQGITVFSDLFSYHFRENELHFNIAQKNNQFIGNADYQSRWLEANTPVQLTSHFSYQQSGLLADAKIKIDLSKQNDNNLIKDLGFDSLLNNYKTKINQADLSLIIPISLTDEKLTAAIDYQLTDLNGYLYGIETNGLSAHGKIEILPKVRTFRDSHLKINQLNVGVLLTNLASNIDLTPSKKGSLPIVLLRKPTFDIFSGRVFTPKIVMDLNQQQSQFVVKIDQIDLESLATSQNLQGILMTGLVSGELPVLIEGGQIEVSHGKVKNDTPGVLKYIAKEGSFGESSQLDYTLRALENYQYQEILADLNYQKDGMLLIALSAKGKSPALDDKREVHLNLNIEENLKNLLFSLKLVNDQNNPFNQEIEEYFLKNSLKK